MTTPRIEEIVEEDKSGASFQRRFDRNIEWAFRAINDDGEDVNDTLNILRTNLLALHDKALTEAHQAGVRDAMEELENLWQKQLSKNEGDKGYIAVGISRAKETLSALTTK